MTSSFIMESQRN